MIKIIYAKDSFKAGLALADFLLDCMFGLTGNKDLQRKEQLKTQ